MLMSSDKSPLDKAWELPNGLLACRHKNLQETEEMHKDIPFV